MSIEAKLEELTKAITENTLALREVLAASASTDAPFEPKPKKVKAKAKKTQEEVIKEATEQVKEAFPDGKYVDSSKEPEPAPEEEPPAKDEPEETEPPAEDDADTLVAKITEAVKNAITRPGGRPGEVKAAWLKIREGYGVEKISELTDIDKLKEALAKAESL